MNLETDGGYDDIFDREVLEYQQRSNSYFDDNSEDDFLSFSISPYSQNNTLIEECSIYEIQTLPFCDFSSSKDDGSDLIQYYNSIGDANAIESLKSDANMQLSNTDEASEANESTKANEVSDAIYPEVDVNNSIPTVLTMEDVEMVSEYYNATATKRNRSCQRWVTEYPDGKKIKEVKDLTEEDIAKYKQLERILLHCSCCGKDKSIISVYKVDGTEIWCEECVKDHRVDLTRLKCDLYEELGFPEGETLYKCDRLHHCKPKCSFIKHNEKNNTYRIVTNCIFCRNYKAQENFLKHHRKNLNAIHN